MKWLWFSGWTASFTMTKKLAFYYWGCILPLCGNNWLYCLSEECKVTGTNSVCVRMYTCMHSCARTAQEGTFTQSTVEIVSLLSLQEKGVSVWVAIPGIEVRNLLVLFSWWRLDLTLGRPVSDLWLPQLQNNI